VSYIKQQVTKFVLPPNVPHHDRCRFTQDVTAITIAGDSCVESVDSIQLIGGHYQRGLAIMQGTSFISLIYPAKSARILSNTHEIRSNQLFLLQKMSPSWVRIAKQIDTIIY
jgi:hypothetical protein